MTISRIIISIALLFLTTNFFGQPTDTVSTKIIGKWLLVRHTLVEKGVSTNKLTSNQTYTYQFNKDGTYNITYKDKKYGANVTAGKWKKIENGKKISLYENTDVPDDPMVLIGDHDLKIIKLSSTDFVTEEYLFSEDPIGTSYYKKQ
ncbi:MAG: hypothetical protein V4506_15060 [Bacteroidota bacterium]